ncbi:hypothetical protein ICM_01554 [Bacillus cereus BAG1X2-3]|jgi:hypothetical protein|uniref:Group-specific protein n=3 Tax=Bacillus cereus group TaxID=86661 RepID=A0A9X7AIC4_BACTU|nr:MULTISPECIES: hypothetical protein [Bacillus]EOO27278.1 hypothetical protein ICC_03264 [Bacillus cereus BAG1X1-1]EOO49598.1 hypothetical protein ICI_02116 [Bacillus cereus BAG1X2-1]EOO51396.1 hypothetical protein ICK_03236 [Bacillus cereus BAG1X2-2]EOO60268.1 hypothetical protein ICM_01554 [Bacillus cereus BAG1X2-3]EOP06517.1 hypothetical protein ICO_02116 [Bacillus cereus BAG2O-1]
MQENVQAQPQLSPPWITYFNKLVNSIGADPTVTVGPLIPVGGNFIILVHALSNEKAIALATLLKSFVEFGNVSVTVIVTNNENQIVNPVPCPLDAFEIAHLFLVALENNPYFDQVVVQPQFPGGSNVVFPVFKAEVIQFFNDDISNLCQTFTGVAANVFHDVMQDEICDIPILFSTSCVMSSENQELQNADLAPKLFY